MPLRKKIRAALSHRAAGARQRPPLPSGLSASAEKGRVTLDLGDVLHRKVKARAAAQGRKMTDVGRELFEAWCEAKPLSPDD
ncbi:MAG: CopG family transcriptional regulator [Acidimicrobiia bacterium]|nr:CopG family transcriptional regulator [Acidimicrobiia bacterium]